MNCIHKQVEILEISGKFGKDFQTIFVQKTKQNKKQKTNKRVSENTIASVSIYFIDLFNMFMTLD